MPKSKHMPVSFSGNGTSIEGLLEFSPSALFFSIHVALLWHLWREWGP